MPTMPRRKSNYKKKRPYKRRYGRKKRYRRIPRFIVGGFPRTMPATLKYIDQITLDAGLSSLDYTTYAANDIYDPYVGTGGHQPMGTDELFTIYKYATVVGSKMTVSFLPSSTSNVTPGALVLTKNSYTGSLGTVGFTTLMEQETIKNYTLVGLLNSTGSAKPKPLTITYSPKKDQAIVNPMDEPDLRCTDAASCSKLFYFEPYYLSVASNDPGSVNLLVEIEYHVVFSERVAQSGST